MSASVSNDKEQGHHDHRKRQAGRKADKKKAKSGVKDGATTKKPNPKAFAIQHINKTARAVRRTLDVETKKQHIPVVDRTPLQPPPVVVAIVGPPGCGKTLLLQGLVRNFSQQKLNHAAGPITVVSGKHKRLTLLECNTDINCMIDVAKCADLVLMLVDARHGLDTLLFEFVNICQVHGFPKMMAVLTHMDGFKDGKKLKKLKKKIKHRLWTELYNGAKLFYLTKLMHEEYMRNEVHNLARFISVMKFRPLAWRMAHPYVLVDRLEDLTDADEVKRQAKCDRRVAFYGYVRGTHMQPNQLVHLPGCADFAISTAAFLPDPCPLPDQQKKRSLNLEERKIFAPMCGFGDFLHDKDGTYVRSRNANGNTKGVSKAARILEHVESEWTKHSSQTKVEEEILFSSAQSTRISQAKSVAGVANCETNEDDVSDDDDDDDVSDDDDDDDDEEEMQIDDSVEERENKKPELTDAFIDLWNDISPASTAGFNWNQFVYGSNMAHAHQISKCATTSSAQTDEFFQPAGWEQRQSVEHLDDCNVTAAEWLLVRSADAVNELNPPKSGLLDGVLPTNVLSEAFEVPEPVVGILRRAVSDCFVTGKWDETEDAETLLRNDDRLRSADDDNEEDAEDDGEVDMDDDIDENDCESDDADEDEEEMSAKIDADEDECKPRKILLSKADKLKAAREKNLAKKAKLKHLFDAEYAAASRANSMETDGAEEGNGAANAPGVGSAFYDEWKTTNSQIAARNREKFAHLDEEARVRLEGFRPGMYIRVEISGAPCELVEHFDPAYPLLLGGLSAGEQTTGQLQARFKHHRWYRRILKCQDPLILSLGWRRFQTMPLYSREEHNGRQRYLKYTPEHDHCVMTFFGPPVASGSGLLAVQSVANDKEPNRRRGDFRVAGSGVIIDKSHHFRILKKLKLIGEPYLLKRKTCFVRGMFNSELEVERFVGARLQTVSGLRGIIKKAVRPGGAPESGGAGPPGSFRATFEDKLLASDIVFCRCWAPVQVPPYFNPVVTLLLSAEQRKAGWRGMRTRGEVRRSATAAGETTNTDPQVQRGSGYLKNVERKPYLSLPLHVPATLQRQLPFVDKRRLKAATEGPSSVMPTSVVATPRESARMRLLQMVRETAAAGRSEARVRMRRRAQAHRLQEQKRDDVRQEKRKRDAKRRYALVGMRARGSGGDGRGVGQSEGGGGGHD